MIVKHETVLVIVDAQRAFVDSAESLARTFGMAEVQPGVEAFDRLRFHLAARGAGESTILPRKARWEDHVNKPLSGAELAVVRRSVLRGNPFGGGAWSQQTSRRRGLESTVRPQGRPKKAKNGS